MLDYAVAARVEEPLEGAKYLGDVSVVAEVDRDEARSFVIGGEIGTEL